VTFITATGANTIWMLADRRIAYVNGKV